jgi:hypothetical protein
MKTGLAPRTRAVSGTTPLTAENKKRTARCKAFKDEHPANGAVEP